MANWMERNRGPCGGRVTEEAKRARKELALCVQLEPLNVRGIILLQP